MNISTVLHLNTKGARPVLKYVIGLKRIINYLISRQDKTDEAKDKTGLKVIQMGIYYFWVIMVLPLMGLDSWSYVNKMQKVLIRLTKLLVSVTIQI